MLDYLLIFPGDRAGDNSMANAVIESKHRAKRASSFSAGRDGLVVILMMLTGLFRACPFFFPLSLPSQKRDT